MSTRPPVLMSVHQGFQAVPNQVDQHLLDLDLVCHNPVRLTAVSKDPRSKNADL